MPEVRNPPPRAGHARGVPLQPMLRGPSGNGRAHLAHALRAARSVERRAGLRDGTRGERGACPHLGIRSAPTRLESINWGLAWQTTNLNPQSPHPLESTVYPPTPSVPRQPHLPPPTPGMPEGARPPSDVHDSQRESFVRDKYERRCPNPYKLDPNRQPSPLDP